MPTGGVASPGEAVYVPTVFAEADRATLFDFVERNSFGLLVSVTDAGEPFATHLPFLLDREVGPNGTLRGHLARANPHAKLLDGRPALAVFSGPHAYVSPTWYEADHVVPTWNYVAVHAAGTCRVMTAEDDLARTLTDTVATFERAMPEPWAIDPADPYFRKQLRGIVGFRIEIEKLEGKWKLNQNHPRDRRERVAAALAGSPDPAARDLARLMAESLGRSE